MHSELISIFGLQIQSYGLCMAIGFICCYCMAKYLSRRSVALGASAFDVDTIVMTCALSGVLGARIVYVWQNWATEFAERPMDAFLVWKGGLVFYGGFLLAVLAIILYARFKKISLLALGDFCMVLLPLGHAFGRLGCYFHGCCFGALAQESWCGVMFPKGSPPFIHQLQMGILSPSSPVSFPVYPTQLFESVGCLVMFLVLLCIYRVKLRMQGLCVALYCLMYALLRFGIECFRDDPRGATYAGLSFSQCVSIGVFLFGCGVLFIVIKRKCHGTING